MNMNSELESEKSKNPAQIYNEKRRIVMSKLVTDPATARQWLDGYKKTLGPQRYAGLKAELEFFERYRKEYQLTPALDVGDATDFTGEIDRKYHRIDVTTNVAFKKLGTYEPFQADDYRYRIAVWDGHDFELVDIEGRILPTGMLLGENYDKEGNSRWSNDQDLVTICSSCGTYEITDTITTPFLYDFDHWYASLNEAREETKEAGGPPIDIEREVQDFADAALRYLRQSFGQYVVAVGEGAPSRLISVACVGEQSGGQHRSIPAESDVAALLRSRVYQSGCVPPQPPLPNFRTKLEHHCLRVVL